MSEISRALSAGWRPTIQTDAIGWCEANIVIPPITGTPWPGPFRIANTPWLAGLYRITQDHGTRVMAIQKGAQVGVTQMFMNLMYYWMSEDPSPILYVMDSGDMAAETSKLRIKPTIQASPRLRQELTGSPDDLANLLYKFKRSFVRFIGASSPGKGASFTHKILILEEPEKYKDTLGKEGNVIETLMERVKRVANFKILLGCTPTTEKGFIVKYVKWGDACKYFCRCPKCGEYQVMHWHNVKSSAGEFGLALEKGATILEVAQGAYYECEKCQAHLSEHDKRMMSMSGEWRPTKKPERTGYRSAILGGLVPFNNQMPPEQDTASMRAFIEKLLTVKDKPSDLQVFINAWIGDMYEDRPKQSIRGGYLLTIKDRLNYAPGTIPVDGDCHIALVVDIQKHHLVWAVLAMTPKAVLTIATGFVPDFDAVHMLLDGEFERADGTKARIEVLAMDSGHKTTDVYDCLLKASRSVRVIAFKGDGGRSTSSRNPVKVDTIRTYPDGVTPLTQALPLALINDFDFSRRLMAYLNPPPQKENETIEQAVARQGLTLYFHNAIDAEFIRQMSAVVLVEEEPNKQGITRTYYKAIRTNDFFDIHKMGIALHWMHQYLWEKETSKAVKPSPPPEQNKDNNLRQNLVAGVPTKTVLCPFCGADRLDSVSPSSYICRKCGAGVDKSRLLKERQGEKDDFDDDGN
jgi:phage terminase large subunit GpA-like protein